MSSGSAADVNNAGTLGRGTQSVNVNGNTTAGGYTINGRIRTRHRAQPRQYCGVQDPDFSVRRSLRSDGAEYNILTKGGENEFHGDLWEFLRNDVFNANAFFRNSTGQPKPNLKQNQFGATLGGPVKRNKLFFFISYQGTRQVNGLDPTSVANLILPPLGNDRSAAALAAQFCPANHVIDGPGGSGAIRAISPSRAANN